MRNHLRVPLLAILLIGFTAVSPTWAEEDASKESTERVTFKRAAVATFFEGEHRPEIDETMDQTLSCPIGQICRPGSAISSHAGITLSGLVDRELRGRFGKQVVSREHVRAAEVDLKLHQEKDTPRTMAQRMGKMLKADVMVIGTVWRYRDRGEMLGVPDSKASVAFAVYFIDVESGHKLWRGLYDATQQAVSDNLFQARKQIKMGLRWLSADELAAHGVKEVFKKFPPNLLPGDLSGALNPKE